MADESGIDFGCRSTPLCDGLYTLLPRRLPQIVAEFENPEEPSIGGPGTGFAVYALVSITLFVVALAMTTP